MMTTTHKQLTHKANVICHPKICLDRWNELSSQNYPQCANAPIEIAAPRIEWGNHLIKPPKVRAQGEKIEHQLRQLNNDNATLDLFRKTIDLGHIKWLITPQYTINSSIHFSKRYSLNSE